MTQQKQMVEIYTDGACKGNPGPGGWGAILHYESNAEEISGSESDTTNNRMELTAAIRALESLKASIEVHLHTDSMYMRDGITKWIHNWKNNGWQTKDRKPVKNIDLWRALDSLCQQYTVNWHWVKGHNGHPGNERADMLARNALIGAMIGEVQS